MNPENNIKRNFLCWLRGHKGLPTCKRCWAMVDLQFLDLYLPVPKESAIQEEKS